MLRSLVNGRADAHVGITDRGFAYGDGVFETLLVDAGRAPWWDAHVERLQRGCAALGIVAPPLGTLAREAAELIAGEPAAVLKLIVTRGEAGRGYAPRRAATATRVLSLHPLPPPLPREATPDDGIALRWCATRLALQPRLAGIKHLNRLEQVLARCEWDDPAIAEGLMLDADDRVVCATAANLFVVRNGVVSTPSLQRCGVAGVARAWVLGQLEVRIEDLDVARVETADELFLTSSLRGILPVARLDGRRWPVGTMTKRLQQRLWLEVPALQRHGGSPA